VEQASLGSVTCPDKNELYLRGFNKRQKELLKY